MKTSLSNNGQIVLPVEFREQDRLQPGQQFEVDRLKAGEYLLKKIEGPRKAGLIRWLADCPEKNWFRPIPSELTTGR